MAYERREFPEWSWSHSRSQTFQECPRKYFWQYYGSHNGWEDGAPELARKAYRFRQMGNLWLELGGAIHSAAAFAIQSARSRSGIPSLDTLLTKARNDLNRAYQESQDREAWARRPRYRKMLHEFYYGTGLSDRAIEDTRQRVNACLTNLLASRSFREAIAAPYVEIREVERFDTFDFEGTAIHGVPDLLYRQGNDTWTVSDWKTGQEYVDWNQLGVYAMYVRERYAVPASNILGRIEWLATGKADEHAFSEDELETCKASIRDSIAAMLGYLLEPATNKPRASDTFPLKDDASLCRYCKFYELNEEEIASGRPGPF